MKEIKFILDTTTNELVSFLWKALDKDELVDFIALLDNKVADPEFTKKLYKRIREIRKNDKEAHESN